MKKLIRLILAVLLASHGAASANFHTFQIEEIFSTRMGRSSSSSCTSFRG
jgi:hypothetical protein